MNFFTITLIIVAVIVFFIRFQDFVDSGSGNTASQVLEEESKSISDIEVISEAKDNKADALKKKKEDFEKKFPPVKWRVSRYPTDFYDGLEFYFDNEYEAQKLAKGLKSDMNNRKDFFKPSRVEVKRVERIGNEKSSSIYYR